MRNTRVKTPVKKKPEPIATKSEFLEKVDEIVRIQSALASLEQARDEAVNALLEEHEPAIKKKQDEVKEALSLCEDYASEHKDELFAKGKKSAESILGVFGLRLNTPSLKTLSGWTFARVVALLRGTRRKAFIRLKEELDKDAVLAHIKPKKLEKIGLKIVQEECFFVKAKTEELTNQ